MYAFTHLRMYICMHTGNHLDLLADSVKQKKLQAVLSARAKVSVSMCVYACDVYAQE
jgi:hypothetical protein